MKLSDHTEHIRQLIDSAFRNRLGRMGITANKLSDISGIPPEYQADRKRIETIREVWIAETGSVTEAYEKLVEEFTFTMFNRLAALKVMEAHSLHPEIVTRRTQHGDRSFAHKHWLEENPNGRNDEMEGLVRFVEDQLATLAKDIPLFSLQHPYHLLPTAIELNGIMSAFNQVETDTQVEEAIWQSDDVLGWLYESYNNYKKAAHKDSGDKTEFNKVSIQSQVYTARWVVKFLVDNSLGKLYLEMYPDSNIKGRYKIVNVPKNRTREPKPLTDLRMIDPATGSGNFLLYGFDLFYDLYTDQIENYGAEYDERKIAELIITHNLHGVDLDDRAIQLAQLGLYIKAKRKKRSTKIEHFNIVSSDFYLPKYEQVSHLFEGENIGVRERNIIADVWADLQNAYKFGALIRLEEKLSLKWFGETKIEPKGVITMFGQENLDDFETFRASFFSNLQSAIALNTAKQGQTFLNTKTQDAITYLQVLTQKYDVVVANPPYTDSADFGKELKEFIEANYKKPYKFNTNLYATFLKRSHELTHEDAYLALIHPNTFMFIKTFEDVRKFLIDKVHIDLLVDYGLDRVNLFGGNILLDSTCWYILSKKRRTENGIYLNIASNQQEKQKRISFFQTIDDVIGNIKNQRAFVLDQAKFDIISSSPFIYWISDDFRAKFKEQPLKNICPPKSGLATSDNDQFVKFWWEVSQNDISKDVHDNLGWKFYSKGGPYQKWQGNLWAVVKWHNNAAQMRATNKAVFRNETYYFREGITYSASGQKGPSFRYLPANCVYDVGGASLFVLDSSISLAYTLGLLNSKLTSYIIDCLNPTVNTQVGDIERIPFVKPTVLFESIISALANENINIKSEINSYHLIESGYKASPLTRYSSVSAVRDKLIDHLNYENSQFCLVLLNEALIDRIIFEIYGLNPQDIQEIENKKGIPVGGLPVLDAARKEYSSVVNIKNEIVQKHLAALSTTVIDDQQIQLIKSEIPSLYQNNNDLEEFCIRHQLNPINVWYLFKESKVLPQARATEIVLEFIADAFRNILMEDEDGIVPLVGLPGEPRLMDRFEHYCFSKGFTSAQIMQLDALIGRPIDEYVEHYFFKNLSDHLNLFMYLPKTPFIWHLSSGDYQGFEAYVIIYKWNRDSLYKLKSSYLSKRTESLQYRLQQIADSTTGQAQTEKETIRLQLQEIEAFIKRIDELIAEGYDPKLDDGVGKNIAPLQAKGMLKAEVLKASGKNSQLQKYLNADW